MQGRDWRSAGGLLCIGVLVTALSVSCDPGDASSSSSSSAGQVGATATAPSPTTSAGDGPCAGVDTQRLGEITGGEVFVTTMDPPGICLYEITGGTQDFELVLRTEDTLETLAKVRDTFPHGHDSPLHPGSDYWVSNVATLWFLVDDELHAVQAIGQPVEADSESFSAQLAIAFEEARRGV